MGIFGLDFRIIEGIDLLEHYRFFGVHRQLDDTTS